jgi:uncharacterized membrane protein
VRQSSSNTSALALIRGLGIGAGLMYMLDPRSGRRRRAMLRDKISHTVRELGCMVEVASRDLVHRVEGRVAEARHAYERAPVDDDVLVARVRSELGRVVSHPRAIEVEAQDGFVTLKGPILEGEQEPLLDAVCRVRGVKDVDNRLEPHAAAENVASLQGGTPRRGRQPDLLQESWSPATRLVAGVAGTALALAGARQGLLGRLTLGTIGAALLLRAATNQPTKRIFGVGAGRRAIDLHKTILVRAPLREVWAMWERFDQFPRFMQHVKDVRMKGDVSHWKVEGVAGFGAEFDAVLTRCEPEKVIAWKTREGQPIEHAGIVRFEETPEGTRLDIRMSYNPPAGRLGHVIASLFHKDPKHALDEDMLRLKSLLEEGSATAHGHKVKRDEVGGLPAPSGVTT